MNTIQAINSYSIGYVCTKANSKRINIRLKRKVIDNVNSINLKLDKRPLA